MIRVGLGIALAALVAASAFAAESPEALGRRMYLDGAGLSATVAGGAALPGRLAACVLCHRPSGYGLSEGDARASAVAAPVLFAPLEPRRDRLLRDLYQERYGAVARTEAKTPRSRPAYNGAADLARALRDGVDPAGAALSPAMPRYKVSDAQAEALAAYLLSLGAGPDPGWGEETIRFATIIAPEVPERRAQAALAVVRAYVSRLNHEIERERDRPGFSPLYKAEYAPARRLWQVQEWRLKGPPASWPAQLRSHAAEAPVFAVVGGIVPDWGPVGQFCTSSELPCIFPETDWPGPDAERGTTLFLSGGLPEEVRLIAADLRRRGIHKVAEFAGAEPEAPRLSALLHAEMPDLVRESDPGEAEAAVLWLGREEAERALGSDAVRSLAGPVYAAGGLLADDSGKLALRPGRDVLVAWRLAGPDQTPPERLRVRAWLRSRGVFVPGEERTQLEAWLALEATEHAVVRLVDRPSRAFLLETIEHMAENSLDPGIYPRLSLGPGQRVAAHGARLLVLRRPTDG